MINVPETKQKELYASQGIYTSDTNFRSEVLSQYDLPAPEKIRLLDCTLREEIVMDKPLSIKEQVLLAQRLQELGIHIIQIHARNLRETVAALRKGGVTKAKLMVIGRLQHPYYFKDWREMLDASIASGVDIVKISTTHPERLMTNYGWSLEQAFEIPIEALRYAKKQGAPEVNFGMSDGTRVNVDYLLKIFAAGVEAGADSLALPDTAGAMAPAAMKWLVQQIRRVANVPVDVHCHNDLGLATANTLASLEGGAEILNVITNGNDPRGTNIACTFELVMAMKCLYGIDIGIKTEMFYEFARWFADFTEMPLPYQKAVVSDQQWRVRYDHGAKALGSGRYWVFPFSASLIGLPHYRPAYLCRAAGPNSVRRKLEELGLPIPTQEKIEVLVERVRQEAATKRRGVTDDELRVMVQELAK